MKLAASAVAGVPTETLAAPAAPAGTDTRGTCAPGDHVHGAATPHAAPRAAAQGCAPARALGTAGAQEEEQGDGWSGVGSGGVAEEKQKQAVVWTSKGPLVRQAGAAARAGATPAQQQRSFKAAETEHYVAWPSLSKADRHEVVHRLSDLLLPLRTYNLERRRARQRARLQARKRRAQSGARGSESEEEREWAEGGVSGDAAAAAAALELRGRLRVGLNDVSRALESERDEVGIVVVCKDAQPGMLVHHVLLAAYLRGTPAVSVGCSSLALGIYPTLSTPALPSVSGYLAQPCI